MSIETTRCYQVRRIVELSDLSNREQREKAYTQHAPLKYQEEYGKYQASLPQ